MLLTKAYTTCHSQGDKSDHHGKSEERIKSVSFIENEVEIWVGVARETRPSTKNSCTLLCISVKNL